MAEVGNANVRITADDSQARSKISGFQGFLQSTGRIATGVMGGLAIFETVKSTFSSLAQNTIGANAKLEQYNNTLTVVLGSSKKAAEMLDWAKNFAATTPFEIPDIVEATTKLETYGLSAKTTLGAIGDMAAVTGKPLMQAVEAVSDAQTGELERLKEFGITKQQIIDQSKKMGMEEVVNSKGQITNLKGFNEALFALMESRYKGGMDIQAKSFNGLISNAKDSMQTLLTEMSKPVFDGLKRGLQSVVPVMTSFTSFITGDTAKAKSALESAFGQETASKILAGFQTIQNGIDAFKQFLANMQPTWDNLKRIVVALLPLFNQVGGAIAVAWKAIAVILPPILNLLTGIGAKIVEWQGFIPIITGLAAGFAAFKTIGLIAAGFQKLVAVFNLLRYASTAVQLGILAINTAFLANPITWVVVLIAGLVAAFVTAYKTSETFRNFIDKLTAGIKNGFGAVITWATTTVPAWFNQMVTGFKTMVSNIVSGFVGFVGKISPHNQPFIDYFKNTFENMKTVVVGIITTFVGLFTGDMDKFKSGLILIFTGLKDQVVNIFTTWKTLLLSAGSAIGTGLSTAFTNLKNGAVQIFTGLKDGAVQIFNTLKTSVTSVVTTWLDGVRARFNQEKTQAIAIFTGLKDGAVAVWNALKTGVINIVTTWWSNVQTNLNTAKTTAISIFTSLKDGAVNIWTVFKNTIISLITTWWTNVQTNFNTAKTTTISIFTSLKDGAVLVWTTLKNTVVNLVTTLRTNLTTTFNNLKTGISTILSSLKTTAVNTWTSLKNSVVSTATSLWSSLKNAFNSGKTAIVNAINSAKTTAVGAFNTLKSEAINRVTSMWSGIKGVVGKVKSTITDMKNSIISTMKGVNLTQIGKNIFQGLINGLHSLLGKLKAKAKEIADTVAKAVKDKLKLGSPSRLMTQYGQWSGEGFVIGLNDMIKAVANKAREMAQQTSSAFARISTNTHSAPRVISTTLKKLADKTHEAIQKATTQTASTKPFRSQLSPDQFQGIAANATNEARILAGNKTEQHIHNWQIKAEEIGDVAKLINVVNGIVQTVRSR